MAKKIKEIESIFGEWTSVKTKLPEMNEWTLIHYGGKIPLIACYKGDSKWLGSDPDFWIAGEDIKWWMKMPTNPPGINYDICEHKFARTTKNYKPAKKCTKCGKICVI